MAAHPDGGPDPRSRRRAERLLGGAAEESAPRPRRPASQAPGAVRLAALLVGVEAAALAVVAAVVLVLTLTSTPDSVGRALAEVVYVGLGAGALGAAAVGLWRVSPWARGPVVVLQLLLGLLGYVTAFEAGRPLLGLPVLALVAGVLWFLATPEARLAYSER
ncbi:hypothetical protein [Modestobacter sp. Leaf380]|uniref:hypothetical protein n=1 Tax=Modestobacter sp. Leaf380 TaxID=1736356 RepID=UPI0006FCFFB6|nr:hypothetical protein [Modestobacter sp. Leaf380]KQS73326.1 hypothetical protein ASG41_01180 [Modestobacter sp. Leaf380]